MAWPKGKKRDPKQKHGGGWAAKKAKEQVATPTPTPTPAPAHSNATGTASPAPIEDATVVEAPATPVTPTAAEPSIASTPAPDTHQAFVASGASDDADFLKSMNLPTEAADKYKHNEEYNTFAGNVKPRGEHANIKTDPSIQEVPEYVPPTTPPPAPEPAKPILAPNPAVSQMSASDKEKAAAALVDVILNVWGFIKMAAGSKAGINIEKVKELATASKLDMNAPIPIGPNEYVTFAQMVESFNAQAPAAFTVSDDFKNKVREPMIREFVKRDIGLTDLQLLMVYWGIEIATTGWNFIDLKKQGNKIIENQMEIFKQLGAAKVATPPVAAPSHVQPDPVTPEKKPEPATEQPKGNYKEPEESKTIDTKK